MIDLKDIEIADLKKSSESERNLHDDALCKIEDLSIKIAQLKIENVLIQAEINKLTKRIKK